MAEGTGKETSIKQIIQNMTGGEVTIYQGTVISADPLKIQIVNDDMLTVSETSIYVPRHLTDYTASVDISYSTSEEAEQDDGTTITTTSGTSITGATMTVHNALCIGDTVHVLSFYHGKQYYVLDRVA